jgi:hypothetical protein
MLSIRFAVISALNGPRLAPRSIGRASCYPATIILAHAPSSHSTPHNSIATFQLSGGRLHYRAYHAIHASTTLPACQTPEPGRYGAPLPHTYQLQAGLVPMFTCALLCAAPIRLIGPDAALRAARVPAAVCSGLCPGLTWRPSLPQDGWTPLHFAACEGHHAVVDMLLRAGARADAISTVSVLRRHRHVHGLGQVLICKLGRCREVLNGSGTRNRRPMAPPAASAVMLCRVLHATPAADLAM